MDIRTFVEQLLDALTGVEEVRQVTLQAEGPVADWLTKLTLDPEAKD
jgi:hypothetical protein